MQQQPNQPVCIEEDEIDLIELLRTIKRRRNIIYKVTGAITLLAIVYVLFKTPLYEVKANMRIGFIGEKLLVDPTTLAKTLQSVYHTDEPDFKSKELNASGAYVDAIKTSRKVKNFLEIVTYGLDNDKAIAKTKELVSYAQKEYQPKLDQYILNTKNEIERLKIQKKNILEITIPNLKTQIKLIEDMKIPQIDKKIELLKSQDLEKLKTQLSILEKQKIPKIKKKIEFYQKYIIKDIEDKIAFYSQKLKEYNKAVQALYEQFNKSDDTKVMIASIQMVNYQNLILDLQNKIKDLQLQKIKIIEEVIPQLEDKIENIKNVDMKKIKFQIDNILHVKIPQLEKEKEKIRLAEIKKINDQILDQKNKITQIDNKIKILEYNISPANIQNSKVVGGFITKDHPAKPKRKLIVVVAFVTGLILSIFLVFLIEFWEENKKRLEEA